MKDETERTRRDLKISRHEWQNSCGCDPAHSTPDQHRLYGGRIYVNGLGLLVTALRVTNPEDLDGGQSEFHPMDADEYEALEALDLISFESTEIDGFSGEWIIYMITGEH